MKTLSLTLALAVSVLALSACAGKNANYDSGASYASSRTAGETDLQSKTETVYKSKLAK